LIGTATAPSKSPAAIPAWCSIPLQLVPLICAPRGRPIGADVIGRCLFDLTNGWNGRPAVGEAVFVVTHQPPNDWPYPDASFTFVTDGLPSALAQAQAVVGDRDVSITPGNIAAEACAAGLIDGVRIDLVPVVFGAGIRFFGDYAGSLFLLDGPQIVQGDGVTHLHFRVRMT
jgi:dihydrofolate reductase